MYNDDTITHVVINFVCIHFRSRELGIGHLKAMSLESHPLLYKQ